jgi:hypothetical protein
MIDRGARTVCKKLDQISNEVMDTMGRHLAEEHGEL